MFLSKVTASGNGLREAVFGTPISFKLGMEGLRHWKEGWSLYWHQYLSIVFDLS